MKWIWMGLAVSLAGVAPVSAQDGLEAPPVPGAADVEVTAAAPEAPAPEADGL